MRGFWFIPIYPKIRRYCIKTVIVTVAYRKLTIVRNEFFLIIDFAQ